jgi:flagellar L-ring protein FlgH
MKSFCFSLVLLILVSCASKEPAPVGPKPFTVRGEAVTRMSVHPQLPNVSQRVYQRMNRQKMEDDADLNSNSGSMWVMDGQGAYLFTQNKLRKEGDLLSLKVEGAALKQIETKVSVIKKLLKELEEEEARQKRLLEEKNNPSGDKNKLAEAGAAAAPTAERKPASSNEANEKEEPIAIESIATKVAERMSDGSFRVRGQHPFMIGKKEYKVIVTGLVRAEDFNEDGVSTNKLLEGQYDVVSLRRKE